MSKGSVLICARVGVRAVIAGSQKRRCDRCQHPVWVAPSGRVLLKTMEKPVLISCESCATLMMLDDPEAKMTAPTPEQMDEIARHREHNA